MKDVADDANDGAPGGAATGAEPDPAAERIAIAEGPADQHAVDDRGERGRAAVARVDGAAGAQRNPERGEITRRRYPIVGRWFLAWRGRRLAVDAVASVAVVPAERQHVDESGRSHAGHLSHSGEGLVDVSAVRRDIGIA